MPKIPIALADLIECYLRKMHRAADAGRKKPNTREGWWDGYTNAVNELQKALETLKAVAEGNS
jgi:hypothetical protein